ncbi:hypothetical protein [Natronococcus sp. A-GB7]|uniref:hypothetical protein n=1 Tax=Natronococcus sp. A-GB7 TaxID=3037649 RepID=UPI00241D6D05|nr:hypothetical protein [Natronococcus sp. A-GB7]MDG5821849.1 hypothetical protein [Natronococcus sp. A-GB7]
MSKKVGDMTEAEIIDYLSDFLITKGEAEEIIRKEQSQNDGKDELEAYGTGVMGETELTGKETATSKRIQANMKKARESNDPDDYSMGVLNPSYEDSTGDYQKREVTSSSEDLDKYGTGEAGDTSRLEFKRRQREKKQAELVADALEERQN